MRRKLVPFLLILFSLNHSGLLAQEETYIGLFVYNFTKHFDWPDNTKSGDFIIQVLGHQSVFDELVRVTAGKKVGTQNIRVQSISSPNEVNPTSHIVFIGHWNSRHLPAILEKVKTSPALIITEMEGLLDQGSAINFIIRDNQMKFEMKASNVLRNQIKIDPRIRELAYRVVD